jgi:branched-subunit amino acid transport protein
MINTTAMNTAPLLWGTALLAMGTYGFRLAGPVLRERIHLPPAFTALLETASVVLLAALVTTTALFAEQGFAGAARLAGVVVGGVLAWRRAPFLVVVLAAAVTTAGLRLLGVH